ncbi:MAG: cation transporter [Phycisphaerales bacterium]|nr:cation transporter [Phycisphaerales bacterium]
MTVMIPSEVPTPTHCPECGRKGKKVKRITLDSLVKPEAADRITDEQYRFCDSDTCETVYFGDAGSTFGKSDLTVRVGVKEQSAPRHVCYCFDHTIEEINAEIHETGQSTVLDDIKSRMKEACWCETKSPLGSCCLGTVGKQVKLAFTGHGAGGDDSLDDDEPADCCAAGGHGEPDSVGAGRGCCSTVGSDESAKDKSQRTGMLAVGGSAIAALAASACCWLPLGLIVFGMSAGGVSAWFEHYRWLFLGITTVLLGAGFYLVYRKPNCAPGPACAVSNRRMQRLNRSMLWVATVFVIGSASFPRYVGYLLPKDQPIVITDSVGQITTTIFDIKGMTCEACTVHLHNELAKVPGVLDISVSYESGSAQISFDPSSPPTRANLASTIEETGYQMGGDTLSDPVP